MIALCAPFTGMSKHCCNVVKPVPDERLSRNKSLRSSAVSGAIRRSLNVSIAAFVDLVSVQPLHLPVQECEVDGDKMAHEYVPAAIVEKLFEHGIDHRLGSHIGRRDLVNDHAVGRKLPSLGLTSR